MHTGHKTRWGLEANFLLFQVSEAMKSFPRIKREKEYSFKQAVRTEFQWALTSAGAAQVGAVSSLEMVANPNLLCLS